MPPLGAARTGLRFGALTLALGLTAAAAPRSAPARSTPARSTPAQSTPALRLLPEASVEFVGPEGGPFEPVSQTYILINEGPIPLHWQLGAIPEWLQPGPLTAGILASGGSTSVVLSIDEELAALAAAGVLEAQVDFEDLTNDSVSAAPVRLVVLGSAGGLLVQPPEDYDAAGFVGGPFAPPNRTYLLSNSGEAALSFEASLTESWMRFESPSAGELAPGASAEVTVAADQAAAALLPAGEYVGLVSFRNLTDGTGDTARRTNLVVDELPEDELLPGFLWVEPGENYHASGPEGGPFTPGMQTYMLTNQGELPLGWRVEVGESWLSVEGKAAGVLDAGERGDVLIVIDTELAGTLSAGDYEALITFTNTTDGAGDVGRRAFLSVRSTVTGMLSISPLDSYDAEGDYGGPFVPVARTYTLSNTGGQTLDWNIPILPPWLRIQSAESGQLAPGTATAVVLTIDDSFAGIVPPGLYVGQILFADQTNGSSENRSASLHVDPPPVQVEGVLSVSPAGSFSSSGSAGSFSPASQSYTLTNTGEATIGYRVTSSSSWLSLAGVPEGVLSSGESRSVTLIIDAGIAAQLAPGTYFASANFLNLTNGVGSTQRSVELNVEAPPQAQLSVTPGDGFSSAGTQGGPFLPGSKTYSLTNTGDAALSWSVHSAAGWLAVSGSSSGALAPGQTRVVQVVIATAFANSLSPGEYSATIAFDNLTDGNGSTIRAASLTIGSSSQGDLALTPMEDFDASGPAGGPFLPASKIYTLNNTDNGAFTWRVRTSDAWLRVLGSSTGSLGAGQSTNVVIQIDTSIAGSFAPGERVGDITFKKTSGSSEHHVRAAGLSIGASSTGALVLSPAEDFLSSGPEGGPFAPTSKLYTLTNQGTASAAWTMVISSPWLRSLGPSSGTLAAGQSVALQVALEQGVAAALTPGQYAALIRVDNTSSPGDSASVGAELSVSQPAEGVLTVTPTQSFSSSGVVGGPFLPTSAVYTLHNAGDADLGFAISVSESWLDVLGQANGSLAPGQTHQATIAIDALVAAGLPAGEHSARISFANTSTGSGSTDRGATLSIDDPSQGMLTVSPATDFNVVGVEGGPFTPNSRTYTLTNTGGSAVQWSVALGAPWISVFGPSNGLLAPGSVTAVSVGLLESQVNAFTAGSYQASIEFFDNDAGTSAGLRNVNLFVTASSSGGWSEFTPSSDTRILYVSSSNGSDSNDGLSQTRPKATISAGLALMRHGFPDWLLLEKGDTFESADVPAAGYRWITSGRSIAEPALFSSYGNPGDGRPRIRTGGKGGLRISGGGGTPSSIGHLAIVGIDFEAAPRNPQNQNAPGLRLNHPIDDLLIEDCRIAFFGDGIIAELTGGRLTNVRIRRNLIHDNFDGNGTHAQGIYCDEVTDLLIEENLIHHNGWSANDPAATPPDIFKHNIYIQADAENVTIRGNIITDGSSHGLQLRPGGICEDNLFVRNSIALLFARDGAARRNVILDGKDITSSLQRRQGIHLQNVPNTAQLTDNVIANSNPASSSRALTVQPLEYAGQWLGVRNLELSGNIVYGWGGRAFEVKTFLTNGASYAGVSVHDNDFQNSVNPVEVIIHFGSNTVSLTSMAGNRWFSLQPANSWARVNSSFLSLAEYLNLAGDSTSGAVQVAYPDPSRSVETYNQSLGGPTSYQAFIDQALLQSRDFWRPEYTAQAVNAYIRAGFGR